MSQWIDIKESLPPQSKPVLISDGFWIVVATWHGKHKDTEIPIWNPYGIGGYEVEWDWEDENIIAWMELPLPPESKNKGNSL